MPANLSSYRLVFAGTPKFAAAHLESLLAADMNIVGVLTQPDRPKGRGQALSPSPVKMLALSHHLPVFQPKTWRQASIQDEAVLAITQLKALQPDFIVVVAYGLILPKTVLEIPNIACINMHASLLPKLRGASPISQAILDGETETGVTIMKMNEGMDTGDILYQEACEILKTDTTLDLERRLMELGSAGLIRVLNAFEDYPPIPQNHALATYTKKLTKAQARIDWKQPAITLSRKILALNPTPIAESVLGGITLRIWRAIPLESTVSAIPGTILSLSSEGIEVATGENRLLLTDIQFPGKKPLPMAEIIKSKHAWFEQHRRFDA